MEDRAKAQSAKIQNILSKLEKIKGAQKANSAQEVTKNNQAQGDESLQTVSDDFKVSGSKEKTILHYEEIIRKTLSLFDISYDDLIRMDGESAYCKAIQFYPHLLDEVKKAECPPLIALQIAQSMKPYMEFTERYGSSLEEIKQNLKEEIKKENEQSRLKNNDLENVQKPKDIKQATIFADVGSAITENGNKNMKPGRENEGLDFLFAN